MFIEKKIAYFVGGLVAGTLGTKVAASKCCKKAYVGATALGLRVKDGIMDTVDCVQAGVDDVIAEAKELNAEKAAAKEECPSPEAEKIEVEE